MVRAAAQEAGPRRRRSRTAARRASSSASPRTSAASRRQAGRRLQRRHRRARDDRRDRALRRPLRHGLGHHEQLHRHLREPDDQPRRGRPGIAEALLATALGLVAAIPAVVVYNVFARWSAGYRARLADAAAAVERLVSRDLDHDRLGQRGFARRPSRMAGSLERRPVAGDDLDEAHEINVTPFIDVMLVLLIIFMIAAPLATVDVPVDLPGSTREAAAAARRAGLRHAARGSRRSTLGDAPVGRDAPRRPRSTAPPAATTRRGSSCAPTRRSTTAS